MSVSHVAGAGFGGVIAAVVVGVCAHFGWSVSDVDASLIGSAALSVGVGLGHVISKAGISGLFKYVWKGGGAA